MKNESTSLNWIVCGLKFLFIVLSSSLSAQQLCPICPNNLSFENGDFSNWTGVYGNYVFPIPTPVANPAFKYQPAGTGTPNLRYAITSGTGTDPNVPALPVKAPCGGNYSARIGSTGSPENQGAGNWPYFESLTYTLTVTPQTAGFTYMYAVVLVDGSHDKFTQPEFDVIMMKCSDSTILPCGQYSIYAGNGSSQFKTVGDYQYTDWSSVTTDLSGYMGQQICIVFRVRDCMGNLSSTNGQYSAVSGGGHQGYAYIDAYCSPITELTYPEFCAGTTSLQICAPPGYKSYSWPAGQPGLTGSPTTQCVTISNPVEGTKYTVTMMSFTGCPVTITIPIKSIPTTGSADTTQVCAGEPDTLHIQATGNEGPYTYLWSHGLGTGNTVIVKPTTTTTYTVTVTNAKNCSSKKIFTVITVPCNHELEITGGSICANDSVLMVPKITGGVSPFTYKWQPGNFTSPTLKVSPATTTTYTLNVTDGTGLVMTDTAVVVIRPAPTVIVNSDTICIGQTAEFIASGASTYVWPSGFIVSGNTATITPTANAWYVVAGTTNGCSDTAAFLVVVNPFPVVTINSPTICAGEKASLVANGAATYTWPTGVTSTGINTATASPVVTTNYTVIGTNKSCSDTATFSITVNPSPTVKINSASICTGETVTLTASGATSYTWYPSQTLSAATGSTVVASPKTTTTYVITGVLNNCSDTAMTTVFVNAIPDIAVNAPTICEGEIAKLIANGANAYTWSPGPVATGVGTAIVSPVVTTSYTVTGYNGACKDSAISKVTVLVSPVANFNGPFEGCSPLTVNFLNTSTNSSSCFWDLGDGTNSVLTNPIHTYTQSGSYDVTLIATNATCIDTLKKMAVVKVYPIPKAVLMSDKEVAYESDPKIIFTDHSVNSQLGLLNFGDGTSFPSNSLNAGEIPHVYNDVKEYCAVLIAASVHQCADTSEICVEVKPETTFYVPNSFTLNNDSKNEIFKAYGTNIIAFQMWIFNRWGQLIFESKDINIGWNGRFKNDERKPLSQEDVYVCKIIYQDIRTKEHTYYGTVTIVR